MGHIHEKIDYTVDVFVVYENTVLLRLHDKYDLWLSVGGHIELDEDPNEAVPREVKEEVGLEVVLYNDDPYPLDQNDGYQGLVRPQFMNRHRINDKHDHVTLVYFAISNTNQLILSEIEKSAGCKWFKKGELAEPEYKLSKTIQIYARTALEKIVGKE